MFWSPDEQVCVFFRRFCQSKLLGFPLRQKFLLTAPSFLILQHHMLYCFIHLKLTVRLIHFHSFLVKCKHLHPKSQVPPMNPIGSEQFFCRACCPGVGFYNDRKQRGALILAAITEAALGGLMLLHERGKME